MPFTLGFYDLFSYLIPGMLYLYVINEVMRLLNVDLSAVFPGLAFSSLPDYVVFAFLLGIAYLAGHIFDNIARWFVFSLIYRGRKSLVVLNEIKKRDTSVNVQFEASDWHLLLIILRQRNLPVAHTFDKYEADSIMFRNISLIALWMGFIMAARAMLENPMLWFAAAAAFGVCFLATRRSYKFHGWFFEGVFLAALAYGKTVNEVLEYDQTQSLEHLVRFNLSRNKGGKE